MRKTKGCTTTTRPASEWLGEIHQHLATRHAELRWILQHCEGRDGQDRLVQQIRLALQPLQQASDRLAVAMPDDGKGSEVDTGTVDVPYPHDGGTDDGRGQWAVPAGAAGGMA